MKRRDFLQLAPSAALALMVNGLPVRSIANSNLLKLLAKQNAVNGRVLVLIQLIGGNDGLNTVIPLDQYDTLSKARPNILIPATKVLQLSDTDKTGMHPSLQEVRALYDSGRVNIVQGVSYPNPNFSHFRATDIWLTASDSTQYLNDGWIGRYLSKAFPGYPAGYPNDEFPDPPAIEIGTAVSTALVGPDIDMGMAITDIDSFYNLVNNTVSPAANTRAGHELTFLRYIAQQTQQYASAVQKAASKAKNLSPLYPDNSLAQQLKIVARLIAGGLQTPVYVVSLGNFDFHANQVDATDHSLGQHANLLQQLSSSVSAFLDDCRLLKVEDRIAAVTFSEFGRRIVSNGGNGTDHGTAEPIMVFGKYVNPGIIGDNPVIPKDVTVFDNLAMQNDYRSVYAAILSDWFQVESSVMSDVLMQDFTILPIFSRDNPFPTPGSNDALSQNYPNPFNSTTTITFNSEGGLVTLLLYDAVGRLVRTLVKQDYTKGQYQLTITRNDLKAGNYLCYLINGRTTSTKKLTVID